ncbi:MAG: hypothetical protein KatS3mg109_2038 [Pirellulaceae bacterium]|nr:MAG: hypothetical protein KatS3mg109_2038 [Pirellulaceae bacterium]
MRDGTKEVARFVARLARREDEAFGRSRDGGGEPGGESAQRDPICMVQVPQNTAAATHQTTLKFGVAIRTGRSLGEAKREM